MKKCDYLDLLNSYPLFSQFSREVLSKFWGAHKNHLRTYAKNRIIYLQGESCSHLDLVLSGKVSVQRIDEADRVLRIEDFHPGDLLGANLLFSTLKAYPMTVVAEEDTVLLSLGEKEVLALCIGDSHFLRAFLQAISDKTLLLTNTISVISPKSLRQKILDYLQDEIRLQGKNPIQLERSKTKLAQSLGVQRTSLSRELQKMKKEGLVTYDRLTITLLLP